MKRHKKLSIIIISFLLVVFSVFIFSPSVQAAEQYKDYPEGLKVLPDCFKTGDCDLNDFVQLFVNLAYTGLKVLPYLAMLMMIWAGFNLIMAGGNPEKIQAGKKMITSIVLGVIIVVILAWTWSFFIVVILTGNTTGETAGYIFKDYPWQQEWWGGGEGNIERVPGTGCCTVQNYGCIEVTQAECTLLQQTYDEKTTFLGENQFCYQIEAVCKNFQAGCCVPKNPDDNVCFIPVTTDDYTQKNGCLNWPATQHQRLDCVQYAQCEEYVEPDFGIPDLSEIGCCVTENSCDEDVPAGACNGEFYPGEDCINTTIECQTGCCVRETSCESGKINCDGQHESGLCSDISSCESGCCITSDNCYASTRLYCEIDPDLESFNINEFGCLPYPECSSGCCIDTCQDGRMNGSCDGLNYDPADPDPVDCSAAPGCQTGCCLLQGNAVCTDDIRGSNCPDPPNHFWNGQQCSSRVECYNTGCCRTTSSPYTCYDDYSQGGCVDLGGIFYNGTICSPNVDECRTDGCCVTPDAGEPLYLCFDGNTSGVNKAYCESADIGGIFQVISGDNPCNDLSLQGICYP